MRGTHVASIVCMAHIQKILVPVDGSPSSLAALSQAVNLAEDVGATIEVLHASAADRFEVGSSTPAAPGLEEQPVRDMEEAVLAARDALPGRVQLRFHVGDALEGILEIAKAERFDLIVMGTHGRVGRLHSLVGSVAEAVVRNSPCPVLTVRQANGEDESFAERVHDRPRVGEQKPPL